MEFNMRGFTEEELSRSYIDDLQPDDLRALANKMGLPESQIASYDEFELCDAVEMKADEITESIFADRLRECTLYTKASVLDKLDELAALPTNGAYRHYIEKFRAFIDESTLPEILSPQWSYEIKLKTIRFELYMTKLRISSASLEENPDEYPHPYFEGECLMKYMDIDLLTVKEYAQKIDKTVIYVRQLIRRGKLRDVRKEYNEWFVSALACHDTGKYLPGNYSWSEKLLSVPEGCEFLKDIHNVSIKQIDKSDKFSIRTMLRDEENNPNEFKELAQLDKQDKESLELWLLQNYKVECKNTMLGTFPIPSTFIQPR